MKEGADIESTAVQMFSGLAVAHKELFSQWNQKRLGKKGLFSEMLHKRC